MIHQFSPTLGKVGPDIVLHALDELFFFNDPQVLKRHGSGHGVGRIGIAVVEIAVLADDLGNHIADKRAADRHIARREALGDRHDMRLDAEGLGAEPVAGAAKAGDDLVGDQEDAVFFDDALDLGPVGARRDNNAARALHRLADESGHAVDAEFENLVLKLAGAHQAKLLGRHVAAFHIPVRLADMLDVGDDTALLVHPAHAAEAAAGIGRAMIGVLAGDNDVLFRMAQRLPVAAHHQKVGVV